MVLRGHSPIYISGSGLAGPNVMAQRATVAITEPPARYNYSVRYSARVLRSRRGVMLHAPLVLPTFCRAFDERTSQMYKGISPLRQMAAGLHSGMATVFGNYISLIRFRGSVLNSVIKAECPVADLPRRRRLHDCSRVCIPRNIFREDN